MEDNKELKGLSCSVKVIEETNQENENIKSETKHLEVTEEIFDIPDQEETFNEKNEQVQEIEEINDITIDEKFYQKSVDEIVVETEIIDELDSESEVVEKENSQSQMLLEKLDELKNTLETSKKEIIKQLSLTKEKDVNLNKLRQKIEIYQNGFTNTILETIAKNIILFREGCYKAEQEFKNIQLSEDESKKYLEYIIYEIDDLFDDINFKNDNDEWKFKNGSVLKLNNLNIDTLKSYSNIDIDGKSVEEKFPSTQFEINSIYELIEYVQKFDSEMIQYIKNDQLKDKVLGYYMDFSNFYERGLEQINLKPIINRLINFYETTTRRIVERISSLNSENCSHSYIEELHCVLDETEVILFLCGVKIERYISETYDNRKNKILNIIITDDPNLGGVVVKRYNDCYMINDRVIYQQKIDVYKYQNKGEEKNG